MSQPKWKLIAQLGDADPIEYGGHFVYIDQTGVYDPEAEILTLEEENEDETRDTWTAHRYSLELCTYGRVNEQGEWEPLTEYQSDGILSENKFHKDHPAWFAQPEKEKENRPQDTTYLSEVADFIDMDLYELIQSFCSDDVVKRAMAYKAVADYHGLVNLDQDPLEFRSRRELKKRYKL